MNKATTFTGLAAIATLATLLYTLRHTDSADGGAATATTAETAIALPATGPAPRPAEAGAPPATPAGDTPHPATRPLPDVPAFASGEQREATRQLRQESLPVFLQAAEATLAQVRADLNQLKARGAPPADIQAAEARLRQLTRVREQVLARNADIALPH